MKKCPQCQSVYSDDSLSFCLSDGTPLLNDFDAEKFAAAEPTVQFSETVETRERIRPTASENPLPRAVKTETFQTTEQSVSRVWVFSTIGLLGLFIVGLVGFGWYVFGRAETEAGQNGAGVQNSANQSAVQNSNAINPTPQTTSPTYRVVGVRSDDVLYIRPDPGNLKNHLGKIPPDGTGITVTGSGRRVGKSTWFPVNYRGINGWVHGRYIKKEGS